MTHDKDSRLADALNSNQALEEANLKLRRESERLRVQLENAQAMMNDLEAQVCAHTRVFINVCVYLPYGCAYVVQLDNA